MKLHNETGPLVKQALMPADLVECETSTQQTNATPVVTVNLKERDRQLTVFKSGSLPRLFQQAGSVFLLQQDDQTKLEFQRAATLSP
jgi:hypothetical protein